MSQKNTNTQETKKDSVGLTSNDFATVLSQLDYTNIDIFLKKHITLDKCKNLSGDELINHPDYISLQNKVTWIGSKFQRWYMDGIRMLDGTYYKKLIEAGAENLKEITERNVDSYLKSGGQERVYCLS